MLATAPVPLLQSGARLLLHCRPGMAQVNAFQANDPCLCFSLLDVAFSLNPGVLLPEDM